MAANPVVVTKASAGVTQDPNELANLAAGGGGAGVTLGGLRIGFGSKGALPKQQSARPCFGVAGAQGTGAQSADAGAATVHPSQFSFPATKYRNAAFSRGMS